MNSSTRAERGSCALACGHSTGALGTDVLGGAHVPRPIPTLPASTVRWVACGHAHVAVVTTSHELLVLGDNSHGQLGLGDLRARSTPQRVAPQVLQVGAGHSHTLFTTLNGSLFSFGSNSCGQLGQPPERSLAMEPELVQTVSGAVCLFACGDHHSVVVTDAHARAVQAFGNNDHGQLGLGTRACLCLTPARQSMIQAGCDCVASTTLPLLHLACRVSLLMCVCVCVCVCVCHL